MSHELKNCPFCNCEMELIIVGRDWWRIKPIDGHDDLCPMDDGDGGSYHDCSQQYQCDEHVNDWNTRVGVQMPRELTVAQAKAVSQRRPATVREMYKMIVEVVGDGAEKQERD